MLDVSQVMTSPLRFATFTFLVFFFFSPFAWPQTRDQILPDAAGVGLSLNPEGTRPTYKFNNVPKRATATASAPDGKLLGRIRYEIDDAGRFSSRIIFGPDDKLRFKSQYKYDTAGRLEDETHLTKDDSVISKFV